MTKCLFQSRPSFSHNTSTYFNLICKPLLYSLFCRYKSLGAKAVDWHFPQLMRLCFITGKWKVIMCQNTCWSKMPRTAFHSAPVQRKFPHFLFFRFSLPSPLPVLVLCFQSASAHAHTAYAKQYLETPKNCRELSWKGPGKKTRIALQCVLNSPRCHVLTLLRLSARADSVSIYVHPR